MTGFEKCILAVSGALLLIAAAPLLSVTAAELSGNDIVDEVIVDEVIVDEVVVLDQEESESSDQVELQPEISVSDNDIDYSDSDISISESESNSDNFVSGNDIPDGLLERLEIFLEENEEDSDIMPLSDYDAYYGTISSSYVDYFRGYLSKLGFSDHYVAARVGQYEYIFAFGDSLFYDSLFSGTDITVVTFQTQNNGSFSVGVQSSFSLDPLNYLVYTDLSSKYPSLATSGDVSLRQLVMLSGILVTFYTVGLFLRSGGVRKRSRRWKL